MASDENLSTTPQNFKPLAAYPLWVIERAAAVSPKWIARLLLDGPGIVITPSASTTTSAFEEWLVARTLAHIRSDAFQASAEHQYLIAEWEQGR